MGAKLGGGKGPVADINMTPLIDIVLVVLIIMMVNIPVAVHKMGIKVPPIPAPPPPEEPSPTPPLVIMAYEDGRLALNRKLMNPEILFAEITRRLRPMAKKNVFIDAHPTMPYGEVIDLVDLAREAGAEKVGFSKLKDAGPSEPTGVATDTMKRGIYPGSPSVVVTEGSTVTLSEKQADDSLKPALGSIQACYFAALGMNPGLNGRLTIQVDVGPEGEVMDARIPSNTNTMGDEAVEACILEKIPGLSYVKLGYPNTARVNYPILFSPG